MKPLDTVLRTLAPSLAVLLTLSGCASVMPTLADMTLSHNEAIDRIERNTLLLNILRASDRLPMNFTVLTQVSSSGTVAGAGPVSGGISGGWTLGQGGLLSPYNINLNVNPKGDFTFYLNPLDNENFMRGFLADIPQEKLYFLSTGSTIDKPLLWTLVTNSVSSDRVNGQRKVMENITQVKEWAAFQRTVAQALRLGLAMEQVRDEVPVGPRMSRQEALMQMSTVISQWNGSSSGGFGAGGAGGSGAAARPMLVDVGGSDPQQSQQVVMVSKSVRFCFDPADLREWKESPQRLCQHTYGSEPPKAPSRQPVSAPKEDDPDSTEHQWRDINVRSPREVFQFVGDVVRSQLENPGRVWKVGDPTHLAGRSPKPLISVVCGTSPGGAEPLATANYRGQTCYVPRGDDSHSAEVMQMLALLVTLSKVQGALPSSPAILIK